MKLLCLKTTGFKNLIDDCEIDFTAKSKKTAEDKDYELKKCVPLRAPPTLRNSAQYPLSF